MVPIKERLSLDWLKAARSQSAAASPSLAGPFSAAPVAAAPATAALVTAAVSAASSAIAAPSAIESALLAYGGELLSALRRRPSKSARLHELVTELGFHLQDTLPVVDYLIAQGYLEKLADDPIANYPLRLTAKGERPAG